MNFFSAYQQQAYDNSLQVRQDDLIGDFFQIFVSGAFTLWLIVLKCIGLIGNSIGLDWISEPSWAWARMGFESLHYYFLFLEQILPLIQSKFQPLFLGNFEECYDKCWLNKCSKNVGKECIEKFFEIK